MPILNDSAPRRANSYRSNQTAGFTLIELLVATTLIVMLMLTISSIFMTLLMGNARTNMRKAIKAEGAYALNQMEFMLRNSVSLEVDDCQANSNQITFRSHDTLPTTFSSDLSRIASNSSYLTSPAVSATSLIFDCSQQDGRKQVKISFTLSKAGESGTSNIAEDFSAFVTLRN
jgi:prepilin-type N-terminal cleavage/methylation domain-containing protein